MTYAQFTVTIADVHVNGQPISPGSPINFAGNDVITVSFAVDVIASQSNNNNNGVLNVYYQTSQSHSAIVPTGGYGGAAQFLGGTWVTRNFTIELNAAQFNNSGGFIFAQLAYNNQPYKSSNWNVVKPSVPAITNNVITGDQYVYYGQSPTMLTGTVPAGGSGNFTYKWETTTGAGQSWTQVGTGINHYPSYATTSLYYRRVVNSNGQVSISNHIYVGVTNSSPISNNSITANQTINEGSAAAILSGSTATGGSGAGTFSYQWQKKEGNNAWTSISNAVGLNYSPGILLYTTKYRRVAKSGNAADNISNEITITVNPAPPLTNNTISISGSEITGSTPLGGTNSYTYKWVVYVLEGEDPWILEQNTKNFTINQEYYNLADYNNIYIERIVTSGRQSTTSNFVFVTPIPNIGNNIIAINGAQVTGSLPIGGTGNFVYSWTLFGGEEPYVFPDTTQSLTLPSSVFDYLQMYPTLTLWRTIHSGNKVSYSNIVNILPLNARSSGKLAVSQENFTVYPNPTLETLNFKTSYDKETNIEVLLFSEGLAKEISVFKGKIYSGQTIKYNIQSNYPKGMYVYRILAEGKEVKSGKVLYQ